MKLELNPESVERLLNVLSYTCSNDEFVSDEELDKLSALKAQITKQYSDALGMAKEEFIDRCLNNIQEKVVDQDIWPDAFGWNGRFIAINEYHMAILYHMYNSGKNLDIKREILRVRTKEEEDGTNEA